MRNAPIAWPLALLLVLFLAGAAHAAGPGYIAVDLGPAGGTSSSATAVNDAGVVAGQVDYHGHGLRAATWTETAGFVPLPILWNGMLTAVSPNGHLAATMDVYGAGPSGYAGPDPHAFAWTGRADAAPVDLGSLGSGRTAAYSVNDAGEVVGDSNVDVLSPLENRAFA